MRIGIDIDGVIADTLPLLVDELNAYFKTNIQYEKVTSYDICKVYNIDRQQLQSFIKKKEKILIEKPQPIEGAIEHIKMLKHISDLFIISARVGKFYRQTVSWLKKYGIDWDGLVLLGSHDKAETCVRMQLNVFIEDSLYNAQQISARGIPVLLLDAPYNRGSLPSLVYRTCSWRETYHAVQQILNRNTGGLK